MRGRRFIRLLELTLNPLAQMDQAIRVPEWLLTIFGVSLTSAVLAGTVFLTRSTRTGIWASAAFTCALLLILASRAGYQLIAEADDRRDLTARSRQLAEFHRQLKMVMLYNTGGAMSGAAWTAAEAEFTKLHNALLVFVESEWGPMEAAIYGGRGWPRKHGETIFDSAQAKLDYIEELGTRGREAP